MLSRCVRFAFQTVIAEVPVNLHIYYYKFKYIYVMCLTVSSGTLNSTILYYCLTVFVQWNDLQMCRLTTLIVFETNFYCSKISSSWFFSICNILYKLKLAIRPSPRRLGYALYSVRPSVHPSVRLSVPCPPLTRKQKTIQTTFKLKWAIACVEE